MSASQLQRALGILETAGVSVAMMAPTAAMALNGALAASYAGPLVTLAFVLAFATIGCVAFAFVTFARTYANAASVGEFCGRAFGPRAGRLAAWTLLLVYFLFAAGSAAECGAFAASAAAYARVTIPWIAPAAGCIFLAALVGTRPARTSSRAMLAVESISVAAVVALSAVIVLRGGARGLALAPLPPDAAALGGLGLATVFALLSFAGFEGAAVLGAESIAPTRTIPRALVASVALAGILYVFVAYAQSVGFGLDPRGVAAFAGSPSPLGDLALRYANGPVAALVTLGASISAFAATLAAAIGTARLAFSLACEGRLPATFACVDSTSATPAQAYLLTLFGAALVVVAAALRNSSGTALFAACGTVAVLALVVVYGAVQVAALRLFARRWNVLERVIPVLALTSLVATFLANVVPVPPGPAALYPYLVLAWVIAGAVVVR